MPPRMRTDALPVSHRPAHWVHLAEVESTNDYVLEHARSLGHGAVVIADRQRVGRGRRGRTWHSPEGNLYMTTLLTHFPPAINVHGTGWLTLLMALSVCRAIEHMQGVPCIKWPNDVLMGERKIAGILAEGVWQRGRLIHAAVGVGVNLNMSHQDAASIDRPVAVLAHELGDRVEPRAFARRIHGDLLQGIEAMNQRGVRAVKPEILARIRTLGGDVVVDTPGGTLRGTATGLDDRGALLVVDSEGREQAVISGEVI